ncbi:hypothetical protein [Boseongicola sp. H5]|uniref:hypothetical protein n=1 Tax=Boseongicola sp. H5 TaxID=2763261 RepID=UPI001D0B1996|nr:hypothetical protein [Boseongicola sp. H5]
MTEPLPSLKAGRQRGLRARGEGSNRHRTIFDYNGDRRHSRINWLDVGGFISPAGKGQ